MSEEQMLGTDNDGAAFGIASPFKPEVVSADAATDAGQTSQIKSLSITTAGQQYPFRRIEINKSDSAPSPAGARSGSVAPAKMGAKGLCEQVGYEELYRMYCDACPNPQDPSMTYSQYLQNPLYVFETSADQSQSFPDAIVMQTSVTIDMVLQGQLTANTVLGVYTCSQQVITMDAQRRVIVG